MENRCFFPRNDGTTKKTHSKYWNMQFHKPIVLRFNTWILCRLLSNGIFNRKTSTFDLCTCHLNGEPTVYYLVAHHFITTQIYDMPKKRTKKSFANLKKGHIYECHIRSSLYFSYIYSDELFFFGWHLQRSSRRLKLNEQRGGGRDKKKSGGLAFALVQSHTKIVIWKIYGG